MVASLFHFPRLLPSASPAGAMLFPLPGGWPLSFLTFHFFSRWPTRPGPTFFPRRKKVGEKGRQRESPLHTPSEAWFGSFRDIFCGEDPVSPPSAGERALLRRFYPLWPGRQKLLPLSLLAAQAAQMRRSQSYLFQLCIAPRWRSGNQPYRNLSGIMPPPVGEAKSERSKRVKGKATGP